MMQIQCLLETAIDMKASDLHLGVDHQPMYRVHGKLLPKGDIATADAMREWTHSLLGREQLETLNRVGEVDFAYTDACGNRFRVNAFHQQGNEALAIRVVADTIPSFESLGLPGALIQLLEQPHGLILVTGPTGSGKTTTLTTLIDHINSTQAKHVITLEDPIEYVHRHRQSMIHQRQIGIDTSGFAPALRAALRQDPDVILVGELRDLETVRTAVTASETGHLVLSTLHTGDAVQTIDRLIDLFPPDQQPQIRSQLSTILLGVVSQRLVPHAQGQGRVVIAELLLNNPAVGNLIRTQKTHQLRLVMQTSRQIGMQTFAMAARDRLTRGEISQSVAQPFLDLMA
ncbi:type IV pilus twitching motility protein PilT [Alicyclobacillus dauci]|uniref:Type IV pilus twitching motility protein PilT n=1 Tax=Alicyclobacillus dauci TaxID=1475485 RepID=A0ABY6Z9M3_9BACL|nr:type IV pilus twitching motility protein PilT [Alicyclobacillus dauci]WAH38961.1 type IV pilus twitching motility protein PilT [Alicyclobacillus dauci]